VVNHNTTVMKVYYYKMNCTACAKIKTYPSLELANASFSEAQNHSFVKHYPKAIKLFETFIDTDATTSRYKYVMIMEYCSGGSLYDHLKRRSRDKNFYSDEELLRTFKEFFELFKTLQEKEFCHRDIKPENIYITETGEMKLGDFGEAKVVKTFTQLTLRGSPYYLSPKLRSLYIEFCMDRSQSCFLDHNPYKSDVYSLGLVFLYMATLKKVGKRFMDLDTLPEVLQHHLALIKNPYIRWTLTQMLEIDESNRPDFIVLHNFVNNITTRLICLVCGNYSATLVARCRNCKACFHLACIRSALCHFCCGLLECVSCRLPVCVLNAVQPECLNCSRPAFRVLETPDGSEVAVSNTVCLKCRSQLEYCGALDELICINCKAILCKVCKRNSHTPVACCKVDKTYTLPCLCGAPCLVLPGVLFFSCPYCVYRCVVCSDYMISHSHLPCAGLFQQRRVLCKQASQEYAKVVSVVSAASYTCVTASNETVHCRVPSALFGLFHPKDNDIVLISRSPAGVELLKVYSEDELNAL
jgi:hypothetical protein